MHHLAGGATKVFLEGWTEAGQPDLNRHRRRPNGRDLAGTSRLELAAPAFARRRPTRTPWWSSCRSMRLAGALPVVRQGCEHPQGRPGGAGAAGPVHRVARRTSPPSTAVLGGARRGRGDVRVAIRGQGVVAPPNKITGVGSPGVRVMGHAKVGRQDWPSGVLFPEDPAWTGGEVVLKALEAAVRTGAVSIRIVYVSPVLTRRGLGQPFNDMSSFH